MRSTLGTLLVTVFLFIAESSFAANSIHVWSMVGRRSGETEFSNTKPETLEAQELNFGGAYILPWHPMYLSFGLGADLNIQSYQVDQSKHRLGDLTGYIFIPQFLIEWGGTTAYYWRLGVLAWGTKTGSGSKGGKNIDAEFDVEGFSFTTGWKVKFKVKKSIIAALIELDGRAERVSPSSVKSGSRDISEFYVASDYDTFAYRVGVEYQF